MLEFVVAGIGLAVAIGGEGGLDSAGLFCAE
jgi:hypothetical protein